MASTKRFTLSFVLLFGMVYFNELASSTCPSEFAYSVEGIPKCYSVVTQRLSWDDAQANCRQLHSKAHLVVVNSPLENEIIQEMLQNNDCTVTATDDNGMTSSTSNFWTSGRRTSDTCTDPFIWKASSSQVQTLDYTNWYRGEPNCLKDEEHCLAFRNDVEAATTQWNDVTCSSTACSICEVVMLQR